MKHLPSRNHLRVSARNGSAVVASLAECWQIIASVGGTQALLLRHAIVNAIELQTCDAGVTFDTCCSLEAARKILANFAEDGDLALDDILFADGRHVTRDRLDEALPRLLVEDLLPKSTWRIKILWPDLGEEGNSFTGELSVGVVQVDRTLPERDGIDRAEVIGPRTLVVECHVSVALEVRHVVGYTRRIDWKLLVVGTDSVSVSVGVTEETRL